MSDSRLAFYLAAALTGIAAAYVLNEWLAHLWDTAHLPQGSADKPSRRPESSPRRRSPPTLPSPANSPDPIVHDEPLLPNKDPLPSPTPTVSQHNTLPPLRTHSLPPPTPNPHAILSTSSVAGSFGTSSHPDGTNDEQDRDSSNSPLTESFVDLLSPQPTHSLSRRRSMRAAHDVFAASHMSFSELGSLVAPPDEHQSD